MKPETWNKTKLHLFEFDGDSVAFDILRGRPHLLQPLERSILRLRAPLDAERAVGQLQLALGQPPEVLGPAVAAAIQRLARLRLLLPDGQPLPPAPVEPDFPEVSTLELNIAEDCNLRCAYCCVGQGGFGAGQGSDRQRGLMPWEVARGAIDLLLREARNAAELHIRFFGGEPLLNWPVIERSVHYAEEQARAAGKTFSFSLVTNGVLLDRQIIDFMKAHHFWLQISLDGTPEMHDAFRLALDGRGSYAAATRTVPDLLQVFGPDDLRARATLTHAEVDLLKAFDHLTALGFHAPEVRTVTGHSGEYAMTVADYLAYNRGAGLLAHRLLDSPAPEAAHYMALFQPYIQLLMSGQARRPPCAAGRNMLGVSTDGSLFPCTDMVGKQEPLVQFGDLQTGLRSERRQAFLQVVDVDHKQGCRACWARYVCGGACASVELSNEGGLDHNAGLECIWIRHVVELAAWLYVRLLRDRPEVFYSIYGQHSPIDLGPLARVFAGAGRVAGAEMEPAK